VREALRGLDEGGLISFEKNRGAFVRKVEPEEADQDYVVRGALEELAGQIVAERITDEEIRELRALINHMERAASRNETASYVDRTSTFHLRTVGLPQNGKLLEVYGKITKELTLLRCQSLAPYQTLDEHREIVERIVPHDPIAASEMMLLHVDGGRVGCSRHTVRMMPRYASPPRMPSFSYGVP
jgi:DNA-binding GntR family transcriptional regulator